MILAIISDKYVCSKIIKTCMRNDEHEIQHSGYIWEKRNRAVEDYAFALVVSLMIFSWKSSEA